jgi:hypothetical protein
MNNNSAVVNLDAAMVVASGLTVREAHANVRDRRAQNSQTRYAIVFDAGYQPGDDYTVDEKAVAA